MRIIAALFPICCTFYCLAQDVPTNTDLNWLRSKIIPLKTCDMYAGDSDLIPVKQLIGDARVVALGEVTHGSSEIYKMKDRLIKYLIEKDSFNVFAIEANMPEAYKLNEYIIDGKGDPKKLIKGMYFWTWNTQEILDLVEWMKQYNEQHSKKIQFTGFDMQYYQGAVNAIRTMMIKYDYKLTLDSLENKFRIKKIRDSLQYKANQYLMERMTLNNTVNKKDSIDVLNTQIDNTDIILAANKSYVDSLLHYIEKISENISDSGDHEWVIQYVGLLQQYQQNIRQGKRDQFMAENFLWIKQHNPTSKFIIWAHNGHINAEKDKTWHYFTMGSFLKKEIGNNYFPIGFTFHKGSYTAVGKRKLTTYDAQTSYQGTYEYYFHCLKQPYFALDLKYLPETRKTKKMRITGAVQMDEEFTKLEIRSSFNAIVFIDSTGPSTLLSTKKPTPQ